MPDQTEPKRGFEVDCPACGGGCLSVALHDMTELKCDSCKAEFTLAQLRRIVAQLPPVIAWLETAPAIEDP